MKVIEIPRDSRTLSDVFWAIKKVLPENERFNVAQTAQKRWIYTHQDEDSDIVKSVINWKPLKKNLCYYIYPIKNSIWPFHIEQLKRYLHVFNGKKIITIATDENSVSAEEVQKALGRDDITWRLIRNDKVLWETAAFIGMLKLVESLDPNEFTFYAHAKGVRRPDWAIENARIWSGTMYFLNLSSISLMERICATHDALGCYRHQVNHCGSDWHYSGTYFWFRNSAVFSGNWTQIIQHLYGVEGWIGQHIRLDRSFSLIAPNVTQTWGKEIKENCVKVMRKHLDTWLIGERPKENLFLV